MEKTKEQIAADKEDNVKKAAEDQNKKKSEAFTSVLSDACQKIGDTARDMKCC